MHGTMSIGGGESTVLLPPDYVNPVAVYIYISYLILSYHILLNEQQFVITHIICQTEIPALLDRFVIFCQNAVSTKYCFPLHLQNKIPCLSVGPLMICYVLSASCKTVYRPVMTNCCFMSSIPISFSRRSNTKANWTILSPVPSTEQYRTCPSLML
jgi:hypothetical protein